jgi:ABC-type nitrate/sulfonate/bicarbonate transport system substrate-binding protein
MKGKIFFVFFIGFTLVLSYFYFKDSQLISNKNKLIPVKVALDWTPNTHYIGMYVAKHLGWYKEFALDVSFILPQKTTTPYLVSTGHTTIGVSYLNNVINAYNQNLKVQIIAALVSKNTSCLSWTDLKGIKTLKDLEGKTYGGFGSPEELASLSYIFKKNNLNIKKVKLINLGVSDFL